MLAIPLLCLVGNDISLHSFLFFIRSFFPTLVAHSDVRVIAADQYLATGGHDVAVAVDTGIDGCFAAAGADGFDFGNRVGNLKETAATGEEMCQKVGTESKAHYGDIVYVNDLAQLIDLFGSEELTFVGDDDIRVSVVFFKERKDIGVGSNDIGNGFKANA